MKNTKTMKKPRILLFLAVVLASALSGCQVTGSLEYQDPEHPEISGRLGITQNFDGKTLKPLRGLRK